MGPAHAKLTEIVKGLRADEIVETDGKTLKVVKRAASPGTDVPMTPTGEATPKFFQGAVNRLVGQTEDGEEGAGPHWQKQRASYQHKKSLKFEIVMFVMACMAIQDITVWNSFTNVNLKPRRARKITGFQDVDAFEDERFQNTTPDDGPAAPKRAKSVATNRWHADVFSTPFINLRIVYALGAGDGAISFSYTPSSGSKLEHTIVIPSGHFLYAKRELMEGHR